MQTQIENIKWKIIVLAMRKVSIVRDLIDHYSVTYMIYDYNITSYKRFK